MAREETNAVQIKDIAAQIVEIGEAVSKIADQLTNSDVPNVRLHLGTLTNTLIPQVQHWLDVAQLNANEDIRSYLRGVESRSVVQKRYDENRKRAAAKKASVPAKKVTRRSKKTT